MTSGNERSGKDGMGEYTVDVKFRHLKRRKNFIRERLAEAKKKRELYHQQRAGTSMHVVSARWLHQLWQDHTVQPAYKGAQGDLKQLFTTLSTTTRVLKFNDDKKQGLLLTDTGALSAGCRPT